MTYDAYISAIKNQFIDTAVQASYSFIVGYIPFLGVPVLSNLLKKILAKLMTVVVENAEIAAYFKFTDFRVNRQGRDFYAAIELYEQALKEGTPDEIKKAEKIKKDRFTELVSLTN